MPRKKDTASLRERYREVVRAEILATTRELIEAHGVEAFTMTRVAEMVDCSIGTLYRHYASKEALLEAHRAQQYDVLNDRFEDFNRTSRGAKAGLSRVLDAGSFWTEVCATSPGAKALVEDAIRGPRAGADPAVEQATTRLLEPIVSAFEAAEEQGDLAKGDPTRRAERLLALVVAGTGPSDHDSEPEEEVVPYVVEGLLRAYGADPRRLQALPRPAARRRRRSVPCAADS